MENSINTHKHQRNFIAALLLLAELMVLVVLIKIIAYYNLFYFIGDINRFADFIRSFGALSPIVFIILQILQVVLFIIPGEVTGFVGGYLFGSFAGTIYTTLGIILGSYFAFALARKFGRPFVERMIGQKYTKKLDSFSEKKITMIFFLIFLLPVFPDDIFCFLAGITKMKLKTYLIIVSIGRFPGYLMLGILGGGLANSQMKLFIILSILTAIILGVIFLFRKRIERFVEGK